MKYLKLSFLSLLILGWGLFLTPNISDYFTLLIWGFGAEATRTAVTDMVRGWGLTRPKS